MNFKYLYIHIDLIFDSSKIGVILNNIGIQSILETTICSHMQYLGLKIHFITCVPMHS